MPAHPYAYGAVEYTLDNVQVVKQLLPPEYTYETKTNLYTRIQTERRNEQNKKIN